MDPIQIQALTKCLQTAKDAGVPPDQAQRLIESGYIPLPWQWEFHAAARQADKDNGPVDIGAGGARGPGKSHVVLSQAGLDDCQRVPGLKGLFLRQTGVAAQESFDDLVDKVIKGRTAYRKTGASLKFPNGSRILLGGFADEKDIDKYIGIEYDFIIVEELNQLTADKYNKLRGSLRTSKPNWRPRMYTSFNPGGIGHGFVKARYIVPFREGSQKDTLFIGSTYLSNPYLNKEYIQYLEGLQGDLGKAWRDGEWEIFAGQFFKEFRWDLHVCRPFIPNKQNVIVGGMDWGRTAPFAFYLDEIQVMSDEGTKYYRAKTFLEAYGTDKTVKEWADVIKEKMKFFRLKPDDVTWIQGDPAMFTKGNDGSISIADQFKREGILIRPASNDRVGGWENLHNWMSLAPDGFPYWQMAENCNNLIRTLPELVHDDIKVEDVETKGEDHGPDAERYLKKALKWIGVKVGGVSHAQPRSASIRKTAEFINVEGEQRQLSINVNKFMQPGGKTDRRVGAVRRS